MDLRRLTDGCNRSDRRGAKDNSHPSCVCNQVGYEITH